MSISWNNVVRWHGVHCSMRTLISPAMPVGQTRPWHGGIHGRLRLWQRLQAEPQGCPSSPHHRSSCFYRVHCGSECWMDGWKALPMDRRPPTRLLLLLCTQSEGSHRGFTCPSEARWGSQTRSWMREVAWVLLNISTIMLSKPCKSNLFYTTFAKVFWGVAVAKFTLVIRGQSLKVNSFSSPKKILTSRKISNKILVT